MPAEDVFPKLLACTRIPEYGNGSTLYDVKFYPFTLPDGDPVFAVTGERLVFICRARLNVEPDEPPFDVLKYWEDEDETASYNSLVWTKHPSGRPLLCIAGSAPKKIKILDFLRNDGDEIVVRSLSGHGKGINDLAVHPLSTNIIASASEDYTIRLWDLRPDFAKKPCVAIFAGEGHRQPILAISFHPNGRWLLSGGLDTAVCLWAVPDPADLDRSASSEDESRARHEPKIIYYPHFYSMEIHHNYVDCLQFHGDLILSRASREYHPKKHDNEIILWRIEGFNSDASPPEHHPIPSPETQTRSAFSGAEGKQAFQRLLSFKIPHTDRFYSRFSLFAGAGVRPILVMGNQQSAFSFWDLERLREGWDGADAGSSPQKKNKGGRKKKVGINSDALDRLNDLRSESVASANLDSTTSTSIQPERKYALSDPFMPLEPHRMEKSKTNLTTEGGKPYHFAMRQMAWNSDGQWLVGVGDRGMVCVFHRELSAGGVS